VAVRDLSVEVGQAVPEARELAGRAHHPLRLPICAVVHHQLAPVDMSRPYRAAAASPAACADDRAVIRVLGEGLAGTYRVTVRPSLGAQLALASRASSTSGWTSRSSIQGWRCTLARSASPSSSPAPRYDRRLACQRRSKTHPSAPVENAPRWWSSRSRFESVDERSAVGRGERRGGEPVAM
jgi:hypothetical protein